MCIIGWRLLRQRNPNPKARPWMKEEKGIIHRGPSYAARSLPQYISAFATRVLQFTYVCVKGERACARIFKLFRHQFNGIGRLVSDAGGNNSLEIFALLKSLKIRALEN